MNKTNKEKTTIIAGSPEIGEGNVAETLALIYLLTMAGFDVESFFPNTRMIQIAQKLHSKMSADLDKTMEYSASSTDTRNGLKARVIKKEFNIAVKKMMRRFPGAAIVTSPQSMLIEEAAGMADISVMICPDAFGKDTLGRKPTQRQKKINYMVWNKQAFDYYSQAYGADKVQLTKPIDSKVGYDHIERSELPFQEALRNPNTCFIKLSGSGGPSDFINKAIIGLWENSNVKSIVFPGKQETSDKIIKSVGEGNNEVAVHSSLDAGVFYNQVREMISGEQMMLTYPSEIAKQLAVLSSLGISPNVCWLPPRGKHEYINLAMSIHDGFSNMICAPKQYHQDIQNNYNNVAAKLKEFGVNKVKLEFVEPENLSAAHFKQSPDNWQSPEGAIGVGDAFKNILK